MMFNEIKSGDIPCLSFLKGTPYVLYVGPELDLAQRSKLNVMTSEFLSYTYLKYLSNCQKKYFNTTSLVLKCLNRCL
jgi:hypothetical protein